MIQFPYGIADFRRIRRQGRVYVDRTAHIRDLEMLGDVLVFLRPRRFGKSLWLQTLASYYDLRRKNEFDELFSGLAIGRQPTPLAHRYFVLQWNFSNVDPSGGVDEISESLRRHVSDQAKAFVSDYRDHLPDPVETDGSSATILSSLLSVVRQTPYKLYLLIDEYDNFVNEVMVQDVGTYHALFGKDGPYKQLFKSVKSATEGQGLERVFVTGVSPVALNDLTSGFNNAEDVSLEPALGSLCGFRDNEIVELLEPIAAERKLSPEAVDQAVGTMRTWYNGYRFSKSMEELVYNPTNALYFLKHLYLHGTPPEKLHDENLRTDRGKLAFLGRTAAGAGVIENLTESDDGTVAIPSLETSFSLDDLTVRLAKDRGAVASLLYYMGLLTLTDVPFRLRIPNLVVRKLFLDRLLEIFLPDVGDSSGAQEIALGFFQAGNLRPLLHFFEQKLLPVLSNRDRGAAAKEPGQSGSGVNEMVVKTLFLSILFADDYYRALSEPELEKGYADLCLLVRPEVRRYGFFDLLFEFKLVRRNELKKKGQELRDMDEAALRRLPPVAKAFTEARDQAERYRAALVRREGELNLRCYAVVAVGLERILGEEIEGGSSR
ncbi:MAG: AAA family ATPase [Deltaproteobacteria bacterium]|nr:AAA family ATPase [Deltaproteobacteria bacterium]